MSPGYLLDTDVASQLARPNPHPNVAAWLGSIDDHDLAISVLTVQEWWKGVGRAEKAGKDPQGLLRTSVENLVAAFEGRILALDVEAAKAWGLQLGRQEKHVADKGIAAIAAAHGCILVSRNVKDMKGLGVDVLDPFKKPPALHKAD